MSNVSNFEIGSNMKSFMPTLMAVLAPVAVTNTLMFLAFFDANRSFDPSCTFPLPILLLANFVISFCLLVAAMVVIPMLDGTCCRNVRCRRLLTCLDYVVLAVILAMLVTQVATTLLLTYMATRVQTEDERDGHFCRREIFRPAIVVAFMSWAYEAIVLAIYLCVSCEPKEEDEGDQDVGMQKVKITSHQIV